MSAKKAVKSAPKGTKKKKKSSKKVVSKAKPVGSVLSETDLALLDNPVKQFEVIIPYTEEIASQIVERVFSGEALSKISRTPGFPKLSDIYKWLKYHSEFKEMYDLAKSTEGLRAYESLKEIAEEARTADKDAIPGLKLAADIKKWIAERTDRKAYAASEPKSEDSGVTINISTGIERNKKDTRSLDDVINEIRDVNDV